MTTAYTPQTKPLPYKSYILEDTSKLSTAVLLRDLIMTFVVWGLYCLFVYQSFPFLLDLIAWAKTEFQNRIQFSNLAVLDTLIGYIKFAIFLVSVYLGWAVYNRLRFEGVQRRGFRDTVNADELSAVFNIPAERIQECQQTRRATLYHDAHGHLTDIDVLDQNED